MAQSHYIYKITDKSNGRYYFGSRTCEGSAYNDNDYMGSMVVWQPNVENLVKEVLETNFETRKEALEKESKIIKAHWNDELNENYSTPDKKFIRLGDPWNKGKKNPKHSERMSGKKNPNYGKTFSKERRRKISEGQLGRKQSEEMKEKMRNRFISKETRKKMRQAKLGTGKSILKLDKEGNKIKEYNSLKEASEDVGVGSNNICACLKGTTKTSGGYKWRYVNE